MTTNFVNVFRHFGPNAEKVLLGKLGLKFGKEYFFEYDENYVSSFPNPSPLLLRFAPGIQQEQSSRFPSFLVDSLPDGWVSCSWIKSSESKGEPSEKYPI